MYYLSTTYLLQTNLFICSSICLFLRFLFFHSSTYLINTYPSFIIYLFNQYLLIIKKENNHTYFHWFFKQNFHKRFHHDPVSDPRIHAAPLPVSENSGELLLSPLGHPAAAPVAKVLHYEVQPPVRAVEVLH